MAYSWIRPSPKGQRVHSEASDRPVRENAGLLAGPIGRPLVNCLVHDPITAGTYPLRQTPVRGFRTSRNAGALDYECAAVDAADRRFGAGRKGEYRDQQNTAHKGLRKRFNRQERVYLITKSYATDARPHALREPAVCARGAATSRATPRQSPGFRWRNSRAVGYQGLSSRSSSQRHSEA